MIQNIHIVGHVCHDKIKDGFILGGTASYGSLIASHLFKNVLLTTSHGSNFQFITKFEDRNILVNNIYAPVTTVFENIYHDEQRTQYLHQRASDISITNLKFDDYDVIFLCPIADEIEGYIDRDQKPESCLVAATIQGWLRTFEEDGRVVQRNINPQRLDGLDLVILSDDDIKLFPDILTEIIRIVPIVVLTKGDQGADVFHNSKVVHSPAFETQVSDLTGAGDVFALAFIYAFASHKNISFASSFAHSAASLSIEGIGLDLLPSSEQISRRQQLYNKKYLRS